MQSSKKALPVRVILLEDPNGTDCEVPLSDFGKTVVFDGAPAMQTANGYLEKPFAPEDVLDLLLVNLGMVQWCGMIAHWNSAGKGWPEAGVASYL